MLSLMLFLRNNLNNRSVVIERVPQQLPGAFNHFIYLHFCSKCRDSFWRHKTVQYTFDRSLSFHMRYPTWSKVDLRACHTNMFRLHVCKHLPSVSLWWEKEAKGHKETPLSYQIWIKAWIAKRSQHTDYTEVELNICIGDSYSKHV